MGSIIASWWLSLLLLGGSSAQAQAPEVETLLRGGQVEEALVLARDLAAARPQDLPLQELWVDLLVGTGRLAEAERAVRARLELEPTEPDLHYLLGRALQDPAASQRAYEAALRFAPEHARAHMGLAALHLGAGRLQEAEAGYRRAWQRDPSLGEAWLGSVRARLLAGDRPGALALAQQGFASCPTEPSLWLVAAELDPARSREWLRTGLQANAGEPRLQAALAEALLTSDPAEALRLASAALRVDRTLATAHLARLMAEEHVSGKLDAGGLGELLALRKRPPQPEDAKVWDTLVHRYPQSALVWAGRARHLEGAERPKDAEYDLRAAVRLAPAEAEFAAALGFLLLSQGRPAEAVPHLQRASVSRDWDPSLVVAMVQALDQAGEAARAAAVAEEALSRFPFDARLIARHAQGLMAAGAAEKAYSLLRERLPRNPDPQLGVLLVQATLATQRHAEAAALLEAIGKQTKNPALLEAAARLKATPPP